MKKFCKMLVCMLAAMLLAACADPEQEDSDLQATAPEQSAFEISLGQEQGTEEITETSGEDVTRAVQTDASEKTMESLTEGKTEDATKKATQAPAQPPTEKATQAPTQPPTEKVTQTPTQPPMEKVTQTPTQPPTEKATQAPTQPPTEKATQPPTEPPTELPTEPAIPAEMASRVENSMWVYAEYIQSVIGLVNARRKDSGLAPLQYDATLCKVATYRCLEIIDNDMFSHTRPDGTPCYTLFDAYGVIYSAAGENLAAGQKSPEEVVTDWINSPGHRANILGDYTNIGVGVAIDSAGCLYWAQSFTKVRK